MSTVQTNQDTNDGEYETIDSFQDPDSHVYDNDDYLPSSPSPPPPVPEYECVTTETAVSKDFEITDCAAYI